MSVVSRLSIGANILLLGIVTLLLWRDRPPALSPVAPPTRPVSARPETPKTDAAAIDLQPKSTGTTFTPSAITQLERMGVSREILVNVLLENLNRRTSRRLLDLQKKHAPKLVPDREMRELSRESDAEQIRELKAAFGEEGYRAWDKEQTLHNLNRARVPGDDLPMTADEAEQAYRLQKDFDEKNRELQMAMEDGVADKADAGALQAQAQQTLDRELQKLLGPQRFSELRGTVDPTTEVYRTYGDLNPTPDQAKAVALAEGDYRARAAALTEQLNEKPGDAANVTAELNAINDAREENLRQIFGAEAYDNMTRQNDPAYKTLQQYAGTWNLNDSEVQQVYNSVHDFQQQAERLRQAAQLSEQAGQKVDWNAVNASIDQAQQQTESTLQNTIGADRLRRLNENGLLTGR